MAVMPESTSHTPGPAPSAAEPPQKLSARSPWLWWGQAAVLIAMVGALRWEGRRWWCECGRWNLWSGDVWGAHNSQHLVDPYAFTHLLHGVAFWWIVRACWPRMSGMGQALIVAVLEGLWEVWENSPFIIDRYRTATAAQGYVGDSIANSVGDLGACLAGFWLARRLGVRWSVVLFVVTEVVLGLWIRDGLLLNILMLVWPVEAIKVWQAG